MCYAIYIGTDTIQTTGTFVAGQTDLYLEEPVQEKELIGLQSKFTKTHIYYIGSYQGCSCGFAYDPTDPTEQDDGDDEQEQINATK